MRSRFCFTFSFDLSVHRDPTPFLDSTIITKRWKPVTQKQRNYMEIESTLTPGVNAGESSWKLWKPIFESLHSQWNNRITWRNICYCTCCGFRLKWCNWNIYIVLLPFHIFSFIVYKYKQSYKFNVGVCLLRVLQSN